MNHPEEVDSLLAAASELPSCKEKYEIVKTAVAKLETAGQTPQLFQLKVDLSDIAIEAGLPEMGLVIFAELVQWYDSSDPPIIDADEFLWIYSAHIMASSDIPEISSDKLLEMVRDYQYRLAKIGYQSTSGHFLYWRTLLRLGRFEESYDKFLEWTELPPTELCGHPAWEVDAVVELNCRLLEFEEAMRIATPILDGELVGRPGIPALTFCRAILCYSHLGDLKKVKEFTRKGIEERFNSSTKDDPVELYQTGYWILGLAVTNQHAEALKFFEERSRWATASTNKDNIGLFYCTCGAFLIALSKTEKEIRLRLPIEFSKFLTENRLYDTKSLGQFLLDLAGEIAVLFDQRNQNTFKSQQFGRRIALIEKYCNL